MSNFDPMFIIFHSSQKGGKHVPDKMGLILEKLAERAGFTKNYLSQ